MSGHHFTAKAILLACAVGLGAAAVVPQPTAAQVPVCPVGYYYIEGYGCAPLSYYYAPYAEPDLGFGFFYGGGWGRGYNWGRGGAYRGGGVYHGGGAPHGGGSGRGGRH